MDDHTGMNRTTRTDSPKTPYERAPVRRPRPVEFAGMAAAGVRVTALEICQSVQGRDNSVTLIAMKPTLVRLYLDETSITASARLRAELCWRNSPTGPASYLPSANELKLDPAAPVPEDDKRDDLRHTLNFHLPEQAIRTGTLHVQLNRLIQNGGQDQPFSGDTALTAEFHGAPPFWIRRFS